MGDIPYTKKRGKPLSYSLKLRLKQIGNAPLRKLLEKLGDSCGHQNNGYQGTPNSTRKVGIVAYVISAAFILHITVNKVQRTQYKAR